MKDSYSLDIDRAGLDAAFDTHRDAYRRIFARLRSRRRRCRGVVGIDGRFGVGRVHGAEPGRRGLDRDVRDVRLPGEPGAGHVPARRDRRSRHRRPSR